MMGLLQRVFRKRPEETLDYEESKRLAASPSAASRRRVAVNTGVRPELLYYLAADPSPEVRAAIAANDATPAQADLILAADGDDTVRQDLARKIGRLAPGLRADETDRLRRLTYEVLEKLVEDQLPLIRRILAEALQDRFDAPPEIVRRLAQDCEIVVAEPVLRFSPLLSDGDLLDIIASSVPGVARAIARRGALSAVVAEAIGSSAEIEAVTALLENPTAQIREDTLDRLIERARAVPAWHPPLVARPTLSASAIRKLATFVARDLIGRLRQRQDIDAGTASDLEAIVAQRLDLAAEPAADAPPSPPALDKSSEEALLEACATDPGSAYAALAERVAVAVDKVRELVETQSAKAIVALCWRAGLTMESAAIVQAKLGRLPPAKRLWPGSDGGYPISPDAMNWQLEFFEIPRAA